MIRIRQLKVKIPHTKEEIEDKIRKKLSLSEEEAFSWQITRQSLDARKKPDLYDVYTVEVTLRDESRFKKRVARDADFDFCTPARAYVYQASGTRPLRSRPVVIGTGPAGLFCGYALARMGYRPLLLERGAPVEERISDVQKFWNGGELNPNSNVQFGEGGAGTFSDGKLNTMVKDPAGRKAEVLRIFCACGAPEEIRYESLPHIGTDLLTGIIANLRQAIIKLGGEFRFHTLVTGLTCETDAGADGCRRLTGLTAADPRTGETFSIPAQAAVLAIGHSARDTFTMLRDLTVPMEAKPFAVGVRIEHPQQMINEAQYGKDAPAGLPPAVYKLTAKAGDGRGVYTFCMCPGGYVVNASSENGRLAVNGMSDSARDGRNANAAVVAAVRPEEFGNGILSGMEFQRQLERAAYEEGRGAVPVQTFGDFQADRTSKGPGGILPQIRGSYTWANVRRIFPEEIARDLTEGILSFDRKIPGYGRPDAVLSGVESRTSSPVRILRDETLQSQIRGLYPCGEGAGYAGGIMSAAMDGLKVAESIGAAFRAGPC